ncbi:MAG: EamA family transporter [Candidatus Cloacimonadota bacterium]|nr:EamA family transporter [Candidatus Cloacimonadota bacterium]
MMWYQFALISAFFSAGAAILEKKTLFKTEVLEFSLILAWGNLFFSIPLLIFINWQSVSNISLLVLYGKTILGMFSFLFVMYGIKNLEISGALPILTLTPGLVAIVAFVMLGTTLSSGEIIGMWGLLVDTYVLQLGNKKGLLGPFKVFYYSKGHHYIIAALLIFTITSILNKVLLSSFRLPPNALIFTQHLFLAVNFSIFALIYRKGKPEVASTVGSSWKYFIILAIFTIIYRLSQMEAVKLGSVAMVLSLKRISVFFAVVFGGSLFKEHYLMRKTIATLVMLAGAALVILS